MRIVIALGGNALLQRGQPLRADLQDQNICRAAAEIAKCIQAGHEVIICHGNGPQVGLLLLQSEAYQGVPAYPLDVLGAESQGMIGYLLQRELKNNLPERQIVTLLNQVEVADNDPAFSTPTKFIGPQYDAARLGQCTDQGWQMRLDGDKYRRVVPSPQPMAIVEIDIIHSLVQQQTIVICGGGGGVPVIHKNERWQGVEAVIDKDKTAACIARQLDADLLLILTDVDAVYRNWGTADQQMISTINPATLLQLPLPAGSMGPKAEAAADFVNYTGKRAAIGQLCHAREIICGQAGTQITSS